MIRKSIPVLGIARAVPSENPTIVVTPVVPILSRVMTLDSKMVAGSALAWIASPTPSKYESRTYIEPACWPVVASGLIKRIPIGVSEISSWDHVHPQSQSRQMPAVVWPMNSNPLTVYC
jgi:hypothetical protein